MQEEWKEVEGYEGYYKVSKCGKVASVDRVIENSSTTSGQQSLKGVTLKQANGGYKRQYKIVGLKKNGGQEMALVHRLVAKAFLPNDLNLEQVNHKDGNKHNNSVENLEWCTPMENSRHFASEIKEHLGYKVHRGRNGEISYNCRLNACGTHISLGYYKTKEKCRQVFLEAYECFYGIKPILKELGFQGE
jgi:hypothetical protein